VATLRRLCLRPFATLMTEYTDMHLLRNGITLLAALLAFSPRAFAQEEAAVSLNVYYSNDLIGYLTPCG